VCVRHKGRLKKFVWRVGGSPTNSFVIVKSLSLNHRLNSQGNCHTAIFRLPHRVNKKQSAKHKQNCETSQVYELAQSENQNSATTARRPISPFSQIILCRRTGWQPNREGGGRSLGCPTFAPAFTRRIPFQAALSHKQKAA